MTAPHDLDRELTAFLRDGPTELPDPSFDAVRDRMETTRQRVVLGPWRVPDMSKFVPYALGAAAVVVALVVGIQFLRPAEPSGAAAVPSVQASAMPSPSPTPSTSPSASPAASTPPLTQTFTSQMLGISVSYPEGWTTRAATRPWTGSGGFGLDPIEGDADVLSDPLTENLFLLVGSQPIGSSTPDEWVAETLGTDQKAGAEDRRGDCSATEPIAVDGATGLIGVGVNACATSVAVTIGGRGYWIRLFTPTSIEGVPFAPYDRAWFEEVLATVQLQPEDAVDVAAGASPPPLTQTFTSQMHGFTVSYPEGWIAEAATEPWTAGTHHPLVTDLFADDLYDPVLADHLLMSFASQPLGDSTPDEWVAEQMAAECPATEPITVDGATGLIAAKDCDDMVAVTTAGRGYWIILRTSDDDPAAVASYGRAWFEEVLATVQLHPEDAVDVAP